ncbi:MAG: thioredoxin domain-containing protein, partial [Betaproteobacteria bacterium]
GGLFDQLGGGFARYSVDSQWTIPHFEKMLYDNGPLLRLLADAWLVAETDAQRALFARCAEDTAAWVMREMQSPAGGYYSTLDADSEGHEGKFYVWTPAQVEALLSADEWRVVSLHFGLDRPANFEDEFWHLNVIEPLSAVSRALDLPLLTGEALRASARAKLFAARKQRIHPGRDEKILVSWNALMIEGMAHAGRIFGRTEWIASARQAREFIGTTMWVNERLLATHKDGKTHLNAYLDDYAFLLKALVELLQADFRAADVTFAEAIANVLLAQFEDAERGGFFFTSHDHEPLIQRPKPAFDNATPSGNGVAAYALQRLAHLTGEMQHEQAARRTLACFQAAMADHPSGHGSLLIALEESLNPPRLLILTGAADGLPHWQQMVASRYMPDLMTFTIADDLSGAANLPATLKRPASATVNAWLCQGVSCLPAITDIEQLQATLKPPIVPPVVSNH